MFGKRTGFGKRNQPTEAVQNSLPPHPGPDEDGTSRLIPKEIWDGKHGEMLRAMGRSPDDASNRMPTPESMQARQNDLEAQLNTFIESVNATLPAGAKVLPWAMVPYKLWNGPRGQFLMVSCDRFPSSPNNVFLLPADEKSCEILNLPPHPRGVPSGYTECCDLMIGEIEDEYKAKHQEISAKIQAGDTSALSNYTEMNEQYRIKVNSVAHGLTSKMVGDDAYNRHREMFGKLLGWS